MISIIAREDDALTLAHCLNRDESRIYSAISAWQTVAGLTHVYRLSVEQARGRVRLFLDALNFRIVPIGQHEFEVAMEAYSRFGKGRHLAKLNMGDCYAYACAKTNHAVLLFKGSDFTRTDIAAAIRPRHPAHVTSPPSPVIVPGETGKDHPCPPITTS